MAHQSSENVRLVLCKPEAGGRVLVDMEAFFDFSFWLAEELQNLEDDWHLWRRPSRPMPPWRRTGPS